MLLTLLAVAVGVTAASRYLYTRYVSPPVWWAKTWTEIRTDLFTSTPAREGATVLVGDSNVERGNWDEHLAEPVLNRGIGGDKVADVLARLDEIKRHRPRVVVILVGNNDINRVEEAATVAHYRDLLKSLSSEVRRVIVVSLIPYDTTLRAKRSGQKNEQIRSLNRSLRNLAQEYGCEYADVFEALLDDRGQLASACHCGDGTHLSGVGYGRIARAIRPLLVADDGGPATGHDGNLGTNDFEQSLAGAGVS